MNNYIEKNKIHLNNGFGFGYSHNTASQLVCLNFATKLFHCHKNVKIIPLLGEIFVNENISAIPLDANNKEIAQKFIATSFSDKAVLILNYKFSVKRIGN